jgi:thiosulfate/3-mercaptopyruvate sulfurtransferase
MKPIITATELSEIFNQENLIILDARVGKNARENYLQNHIKGALFINLDEDLAEIGENAASEEDILCQKFQNLLRFYKI